MSFHLLALNRILMRFRCREDMQFGIICLRNPSPSEPSHAGRRALKLVKQTGLKSNALFATFASEATATAENDGLVFQETSAQALQMFDIVFRNPVSLDLLLKELQTISEGATNRKEKGSKSWLRVGRRGT